MIQGKRKAPYTAGTVIERKEKLLINSISRGGANVKYKCWPEKDAIQS